MLRKLMYVRDDGCTKEENDAYEMTGAQKIDAYEMTGAQKIDAYEMTGAQKKMSTR